MISKLTWRATQALHQCMCSSEASTTAAVGAGYDVDHSVEHARDRAARQSKQRWTHPAVQEQLFCAALGAAVARELLHRLAVHSACVPTQK